MTDLFYRDLAVAAIGASWAFITTFINNYITSPVGNIFLYPPPWYGAYALAGAFSALVIVVIAGALIGVDHLLVAIAKYYLRRAKQA